MATSTKDNSEAAAAAGVAVPVSSYSDYSDAIGEQQKTARLRSGSIDAGDYTTGWTAQSSNSLVAPQDVPGQVYLPEQLPDPSVAERAGLPAVLIPEYLVTEDEDHPQGPEPWETGSDPRDVRDAVRSRVLREFEENQSANDTAQDSAAAKKAPATKTAASTSSS